MSRSEKAKVDVMHVEDAIMSSAAPVDAEQVPAHEIDEGLSVAGETSSSHHWYSRFLKQPPSQKFLDDVMHMNTVELDEAQVKRLVRRLDLLICPALAVCYAFYYMCATYMFLCVCIDMNLAAIRQPYLMRPYSTVSNSSCTCA
jgi:hypothetical protein